MREAVHFVHHPLVFDLQLAMCSRELVSWSSLKFPFTASYSSSLAIPLIHLHPYNGSSTDSDEAAFGIA